MQKNKSRLKASAAKHYKTPIAWILPFVLIPTSHALPSGLVGTIYNGPLPSDVSFVCVQSTNCSVRGTQEVWYGSGNSWVYKVMSGKFSCDSATFSDAAPNQFKSCYSRDLMMSEVQPPAVTEIPLEFDLNDLLTVQNKRYTFSVWDGNVLKPVKTNTMAINLKSEKLLLRLQQNYFQFDIIDGDSPIRQHSVFISPTFNRCLNSHVSPSGNVISTYRRIVEIFSLTSLPTTQLIPQRSDTQKICTNDRGQLKFNLKPPGIDSYQIKVVSYEASGKPNDVLDFFIPINFDWKTK